MREELFEKLQSKLNVNDLNDAKPNEVMEALRTQLDDIDDNLDALHDATQVFESDRMYIEEHLNILEYLSNPKTSDTQYHLTEDDFAINDDETLKSNTSTGKVKSSKKKKSKKS
jgi:hypothetical protein